jgi:hypothetical protein
MLVLSGCSTERFSSSIYGDIAMASRYAAATCRAHQPAHALLRAERVGFIAHLYNAVLLVRDGSGEHVYLQDGCAGVPRVAAVDPSALRALAASSRGLSGDFFVGRGYFNGFVYFAHSEDGAIDFAVYEPDQGHEGATAAQLARLRAWSAYFLTLPFDHAW